ncbi:ABC transporter permease [Myxococcus qinghaiensis]|uniref:ABC transporter permease n=1 Tax=Myxococcus qinghaiensis TaxID=2906758 RepID=UPI0020A779A8|nr:ADOP family duplicated permease [Myxococcus qinghaiensis]MCP3167974.1 ABC transporter permease [Myxococcus qinghaiensis]
MFETLWQDLRYGARVLVRGPGFTVAILVTLALGIGANTAIFSVIHGVLLRPLPYGDGERLVHLDQPVARLGGESAGFSPLELEDYRQRLTGIQRLVEYHSMPFHIVGHGEPRRVQTAVVSSGFFDTLGVRPLLGRTFLPDEEKPGAAPVLILSHAYWQRELGGDPTIVGKTFTMNGRTHTVIGVLPPVPQYPGENDVYMPVSACPFRSGEHWAHTRTSRGLTVLGRLAPGVSLGEARAELERAAASLHQAWPEAYPSAEGFTATASRIQDRLVARARPTLLLLFVTAVFLLLIVCANVANLTLARLARREHELAVRVAVGAGQGRLARQLLTEHLLLSFLGGLLGLVVAVAGMELLVAFVARYTSRAVEVEVGASMLLINLGLSLGTGLVLSLLPALPARTLFGAVAMQGAGGSRVSPRLRGFFIVSQVALSCVLLVGAGLMLRSMVSLHRVDPGFDPENVLTARVDLGWDRYREDDKVRAFAEQLVPRLEELPGVTVVGLANELPLGGNEPWTMALQVEGEEVSAGQVRPRADLRSATSGYFHALGVPLLKGRLFEPGDRPDTAPVVVVNQAFARTYLAGGEPLGRRISFDEGRNWVTVVGVVGDVRERGLGEDPPREVYLPFALQPLRDLRILVRTSGAPMALAPHLRELVHELDSVQPVTDVRSLSSLRSESLAAPRLVTLLLGFFAVLALVLTCTGLTGVVAFSVSQRVRELGIRLALGAEPSSVLGLVLRQGMSLVLAGLLMGTAGALGLSSLMEGLLFGVEPTDPLTLVGVVLLLGGTGAVACLLPALRAARTDPAIALRST